MVELYRAVATIAGRDTVVDSSKYPTTALALSEADDIDLRLIHMVRDPRAVAYSWSHPKIDRNIDPPILMKALPLWLVVPQWDLWNTFAERVGGRVGPYMQLRYEDLASNPGPILERVLEFGGIPGETEFLSRDGARIAANHMLSGNPSRFEVGAVRISPDLAWMTKMPRHQQKLASALSVGWRRRFGYD
jgi:hypothetical protein